MENRPSRQHFLMWSSTTSGTLSVSSNYLILHSPTSWLPFPNTISKAGVSQDSFLATILNQIYTTGSFILTSVIPILLIHSVQLYEQWFKEKIIKITERNPYHLHPAKTNSPSNPSPYCQSGGISIDINKRVRNHHARFKSQKLLRRGNFTKNQW